MLCILVSLLFGKYLFRYSSCAVLVSPSCVQEEDGFLSMNSLYGSVRLSQDSDNVIILQDQELMNEMRSQHDSGSYHRDARPSPVSPYQNPSKFIQVEFNNIFVRTDPYEYILVRVAEYSYSIAEYNYLKRRNQ